MFKDDRKTLILCSEGDPRRAKIQQLYLVRCGDIDIVRAYVSVQEPVNMYLPQRIRDKRQHRLGLFPGNSAAVAVNIFLKGNPFDILWPRPY